MPEKTKTKAKRRPTREVPAPIVQVMPAGRARIDPSVRTDLAAFILSLRERYVKQATMSIIGCDVEEQRRRARQIEYATRVISAYDEILRTINETVSLDHFEHYKQLMAEELAAS